MEGQAETVKDILLKNSTVSDERDALSMTPLHWAAIGGYSDVVLILLEYGADPNSSDEDNNTALHLSANPSTTQTLVLGGSNINAQNAEESTPLHLATAKEDYNIVRRLLRFGAATNITDRAGRFALDVAIDTKNLGVIKILKSCGAKTYPRSGLSTTTAAPSTSPKPTRSFRETKSTRRPEVRGLTEMERKLSMAARNGSQDTVVELCGEGVDPNVADISDNNHTPLHIASLVGNIDTVLPLLRCGANMDFGDADGNTPLHLAVKNGHYKVSDTLLFSGADPKISNRVGMTANQLAQKAKSNNFRDSFAENILEWIGDARELTKEERNLHEYTKKGYYISIADLCKKGIDVQVKDIENKENTALHLAAEAEVAHIGPMILALIKCGANVNARNLDGDTPLHSAIVEGSDAAFSVLLLNRAELFLPNKEGKTAYQLALQKGTGLMKRMVSSSSYNWIVNNMLV